MNNYTPYTPIFFDPTKAFTNFTPDIAGAFKEGFEYGRKNELITGQQLIDIGQAHGIALTDLQKDFCEGGRLAVKGATQVVFNVCKRLIDGTVKDHYFGEIFISLDGHHLDNISLDMNWLDALGNPLDLSQHGNAAIMTLHDEKNCVFKATAFGPNGPYEVGHYKSVHDPADVLDYWYHLQTTGQGPIWAFVPHCIIGTDGVNLHPLLVETLAFIKGARDITPVIIQKGHLANTDWFGPLAPCRPDAKLPNNGVQVEVLEAFKKLKTIEFAGIAEDFCEYNMRKQAIDLCGSNELITRYRFLSDGTAPIVPNAPHVQALYQRAREKNVKFINHDSPFSE
jgi:nicotinamidase-related amidase